MTYASVRAGSEKNLLDNVVKTHGFVEEDETEDNVPIAPLKPRSNVKAESPISKRKVTPNVNSNVKATSPRNRNSAANVPDMSKIVEEDDETHHHYKPSSPRLSVVIDEEKGKYSPGKRASLTAKMSARDLLEKSGSKRGNLSEDGQSITVT